MAKRNPEKNKEQILKAATREFSDYGLGGARVDAIADRAKANKRMLYHYYGNKDDLFLAVLESAYEKIRTHETKLDLQKKDPETAIRELVAFTFSYFVKNPEFMRLLNNENLYAAEHIKKSNRIQEMHSPLVGYIEDILSRGVKTGVFRNDVDAVQLYVTIASLGYFYLSNVYTLGTIFGRNLKKPAALQERLNHAIDVVLGYLRP